MQTLSPLKKHWRIWVSVLVLWAFVPASLSYAVSTLLQHRLGIRVTGNFIPSLFVPNFSMKNASFEWKDKVQLVSGDLKVEYRPLSLLPWKRLRIRLSGKGFHVNLLGSWAKMQGVQNAVVDSFGADFEMDAREIREIYLLDAQSKAFQFHIQQSEKKV